MLCFIPFLSSWSITSTIRHSLTSLLKLISQKMLVRNCHLRRDSVHNMFSGLEKAHSVDYRKRHHISRQLICFYGADPTSPCVSRYYGSRSVLHQAHQFVKVTVSSTVRATVQHLSTNQSRAFNNVKQHYRKKGLCLDNWDCRIFKYKRFYDMYSSVQNDFCTITVSTTNIRFPNSSSMSVK